MIKNKEKGEEYVKSCTGHRDEWDRQISTFFQKVLGSMSIYYVSGWTRIVTKACHHRQNPRTFHTQKDYTAKQNLILCCEVHLFSLFVKNYSVFFLFKKSLFQVLPGHLNYKLTWMD
jgi:hypothetical protein